MSKEEENTSSSCRRNSVYLEFVIILCAVVFLTILFSIPIKWIVEQFTCCSCIYKFILITIILCVISAGYIITLLCIRKYCICSLNIYRIDRTNEINRMYQAKQATTDDSNKKDSENNTPSHSTNQSDKTEQNVAKCNDCNKQDDVSVQITLGVKNSIDVHTNKNN